MIWLWRGFHSAELAGLVRRAWAADDLVILCPPSLKDFSFAAALPQGPVELKGAWAGVDTEALKTLLPSRGAGGGIDFLKLPVLGVFTSGTTTGLPRLILYSKENIQNSLDAIRSVFDTKRIRKLFCFPQPTHAFGLILGYVHSVLYNLEFVSLEGRYRRDFHRIWCEEVSGHTLTLGTPTHFQDLVDYVSENGLKVPASYSCIAGGAKVTVSLWKALQAKLHIQSPSIGYGATEVALGVTHHPPGLKPLVDGEVGFLLPHIQMGFIPGQGLELRGPTVCAGIIENGALRISDHIFVRDDLEKRESDGMFLYRGRLDFTLNRGGTKFSLEHVESVIESKLNLQVMCVALSDLRLGEELGILAATASGLCDSAQKDKIYEMLFREFGHRFAPENFLVLENLPLTAQSKLDRVKGQSLFRKSRHG